MRLRSASDRRKVREQPGDRGGRRGIMPTASSATSSDRSIDQEIDRLAESHRLPVVLCCLEGVSHEEAAQRLRWPLGTVKSRLARGRKRLQERLVRRGIAPRRQSRPRPAGLLGSEASAAVPPALSMPRQGRRGDRRRSRSPGVVPASLSALVREELSSMIAAKLKLAVGIPLAAGASAASWGSSWPRAARARGRRDPMLPLPRPPAHDKPKAQAEAPGLGRRSSRRRARSSTSGPARSPAARVILREWSGLSRARDASQGNRRSSSGAREFNDTLTETKTDDAGRFAFQDVPAPAFPHIPEAGQSVYPWDIVALAQGHGLAWVQLTPQNQRTPDHAEARAGGNHPRPGRRAGRQAGGRGEGQGLRHRPARQAR